MKSLNEVSLTAYRLTTNMRLACMFFLALITLPASAADISTGFEFDDIDGQFTLGTAPKRATFSGGQAKITGQLNLYHTGFHAWMIKQDTTANITFETPGELISFWLKKETSNSASTVDVLDVNDAIIQSVTVTTSWVQTTISRASGETGIAALSYVNNGNSGYAVMDDFTYTAQVVTMEPDPDPDPLVDPLPNPITNGGVEIRLEQVASGLTAPNWGQSAPGIASHLFVSDQDGKIWNIDLVTRSKTISLDLSARLVTLGITGPGSFDERGLLGFAFHPDFATNGFIYTYSSEPVTGTADFSTLSSGEQADHHSVLLEWRVDDPAAAAAVVNPGSAREVLRIDQPQFNHDGGGLAFGSDDLLYISLGDGGSADDQGTGHGTAGNGQDAANVLGTLLRIDPRGTNGLNGQYGIPGTNPFVGTANKLDEIYAYGFRNPLRFSFDTNNGDLYLADVGQNDIEEINLVKPGSNYGWNLKEGSFGFFANGDLNGFVFNLDQPITGLSDPLAQYDHDEGSAVIGGFVYRGTRVTELVGRYVFGDFSGRLFYLDSNNDIQALQIFDRPDGLGESGSGQFILGFGQDEEGNIYVMANSTGTPFDSTGVVYKIVPIQEKPGDFDRDDKADLAIWRPTNGNWFIRRTGDGGLTNVVFGLQSTDVPVAADFDGDGKPDMAIWRPTDGNWFIRQSSLGNAVRKLLFGTLETDIPVPADYDGDGLADIAIRRPSTGQWIIKQSSDGKVTRTFFGTLASDVPTVGDYDGDGKADIAIWRQTNGNWFIRQSADDKLRQVFFGALPTDVPVPGDYDGDGKTDLAFWRQDTGTWFIRNSSDNSLTKRRFGTLSTDIPVPLDYDGDGRTDIAIKRPTTGQFMILRSSDGVVTRTLFGTETSDVPIFAATRKLLELTGISSGSPASQSKPLESNR